MKKSNKDLKAFIIVATLLAGVFIVFHITPQMAMRTKAVTLLNGHTLPLNASEIEVDEFHNKSYISQAKKENGTFYYFKSNAIYEFFRDKKIIWRDMSEPFGWLVSKKGFLYFAEPVGY
ncbi:hypothetical protein [Peptostreptococcus faecalis]|uniref:hypothetical protein n=1 Tax=Peptostreptococcus faecalis TaxID=2045015 RepID=UPI000C7A2AEC|nr:hypothetical protein [Peptostreptococcus faecalis]